MALYWKVYIHSNQCHENTSGQRVLPRASAECCCHIASGNLITIGTSSSEQRRANRASKGRRCHGTQPFSTHAPTFEPASQNHSRPASAFKGRASKGHSMWLSSSRRPSALNIRRPTLMSRELKSRSVPACVADIHWNQFDKNTSVQQMLLSVPTCVGAVLLGGKPLQRKQSERGPPRGVARRASESGGRVLGICPKRRALFLYKNIISVWLKHWTGQPSDPFGLNSNPDPFGFQMLRISCQSSI